MLELKGPVEPSIVIYENKVVVGGQLFRKAKESHLNSSGYNNSNIAQKRPFQLFEISLILNQDSRWAEYSFRRSSSIRYEIRHIKFFKYTHVN